MVEYKNEHLNQVFHALADSTRRKLLQRIARQRVSHVTQLAEPFDMSLNAVSKHLKVLENAGLIKREKKGRTHYMAFNQKPLEDAAALINQLNEYWEMRLDSLENFLRTTKSKSTSKKGK